MRQRLAILLLLSPLLSPGEAKAQQGDPPPPPPVPEESTTLPTSQPASLPTSRPTTQPADSVPPATAAGARAEDPDPYAGLDHTGTPPLPPEDRGLPARSAKPGEQRPVPNYDGRPPEPLSAGEGLIWVPRVIFYPVHLVLEYGLRWPIVQGITFAEKHYLFERVKRVFTFDEGKGGIFPTLFFDFGVNPSAGFYFFYDDLVAEGNDLTLQAGFWADDWYHLVATDSCRVFRDDSGLITLRGEFIYRPDQVFRVFTELDQATLDRFTTERFFRARQTEIELSLRAFLQRLNRVNLALFYRNTKIENGYDPPLEALTSPLVRNDQGFVPSDPEMRTRLVEQAIPGYNSTYNLLETKVRFELDSRHPDRVFTPGSGLRLELFGSFAFDPGEIDLNFFRWGGEAAGFWDVSGINHVLALHLYIEALERTGDAVVPLTERISLGGPEHLRGFLEGWLRGDSALVVTADYRYPIWSFLDANIFASLGNVFPGRFEKLHVKRLVLNWGIGFRSNTSREVSFDFLVGFGTNRIELWDEDFNVDHVRVIFGINQGF
jgi:hypothetical protein